MIELVYGTCFVLLVVIVFGWLGFFSRIWTALFAFVFMVVMLGLPLGVNSYVLLCVVVAAASLFGANQWARHRHSNSRKEAQK